MRDRTRPLCDKLNIALWWRALGRHSCRCHLDLAIAQGHIYVYRITNQQKSDYIVPLGAAWTAGATAQLHYMYIHIHVGPELNHQTIKQSSGLTCVIGVRNKRQQWKLCTWYQVLLRWYSWKRQVGSVHSSIPPSCIHVRSKKHSRPGSIWGQPNTHADVTNTMFLPSKTRQTTTGPHTRLRAEIQ